jgi:peptidoglycan/LPS O-acetylase OafA/YrhL
MTIKIYIPFIISILIWGIYVSIFGWSWGQETTFVELFKDNMQSLTYKLTLISNFIPGELYSINGPWWFISLIFQFYIIFPFLLKMAKTEDANIYLGALAIAGILYAMIIFAASSSTPLIYGTFIPHLPEFILGIYLAKNDNIIISKKIIIGSLIIFTLGNFIYPLWFFTDITALILMIVIFQKLKENVSKNINKFILEVGVASMFIFYINGFMRNPLVNVANYYESWWGTILIALIFFMIVLFFSMILTRINSYIDKKII